VGIDGGRLVGAPTLHKASPSPPPEAIKLPLGEKVTESTSPVCPVKVLTKVPSVTLHILMVLSKLPEAIKFPLGEKVTEYTLSVCPVKVLTKVPSDTLKIPIPPPLFGEAKNCPSGEKTTSPGSRSGLNQTNSSENCLEREVKELVGKRKRVLGERLPCILSNSRSLPSLLSKSLSRSGGFT
jgi:hypothetical protein